MTRIERGKYKYICKACGKEFISKSSQPRSFCSEECRRKPESHPRWKGGLQTYKCVYCGKEFQRSPASMKGKELFYCSRVCKGKYRSENMIGENACNWRGGNYKRTCIVCGKEFEVRRYVYHQGKNGICCSNECRYKRKRMTMSGDGNPMYVDGQSHFPYCEKFNVEFKRRVRDFFNNTCVLCGTTSDDIGRQMAVHHVYGNKQACCDSSQRRFVTLCMSCHTKVSNAERYDPLCYTSKFNNIIDGLYGGKCYFTREEYYGFTDE
jgi:hypothetical protein